MGGYFNGKMCSVYRWNRQDFSQINDHYFPIKKITSRKKYYKKMMISLSMEIIDLFNVTSFRIPLIWPMAMCPNQFHKKTSDRKTIGFHLGWNPWFFYRHVFLRVDPARILNYLMKTGSHLMSLRRFSRRQWSRDESAETSKGIMLVTPGLHSNLRIMIS